MEGISSYELTEWMIYDQTHPIGEEQANVRNAMVLQVLHSIRAPKKTPPPIDKLMPKWERKIEQTADDLLAKARAITGIMNRGRRPR